MSGYQRILTPRFYASLPHLLVARGELPSDVVQLDTGAIADGNIVELIDSAAQHLVTFNTSGSATELHIAFDLRYSSVTSNFLAILNHNLQEAGAKVQFLLHTADVYGSATAVTLTDIVGDLTASSATTNGSLLFTYLVASGASKRYGWLRIYPAGATFTADIKIGQVMVGTYFTLPYGVDEKSCQLRIVPTNRKTTETPMGRRNAGSGWTTGSERLDPPFGVPFRSDSISYAWQRHVGRRTASFNLPYFEDTYIFPQDLAGGIDLDGGISWDLVSMLDGGTIPCIYTPDKDSKVTGDYCWCRLTKIGQLKQVAARMWSYDITIEEEF